MFGLPEAAGRESRDRVRAAIRCAQFEFPQRAITINLAPADLPNAGGRFDLPIALGILAARGQVPVPALAQWAFLGELALTEIGRAPCRASVWQYVAIMHVSVALNTTHGHKSTCY